MPHPSRVQAVSAAQHPGRLPELRAPRATRRPDSVDGRPGARGAHQELRSLRPRDRPRRRRSHGLQARHRDHPVEPLRPQLLRLGHARSLRSCPWQLRSSAIVGSCSTASASASCPTPPRTATRAATRSATSRGACRCTCRRCAASGSTGSCRRSAAPSASGRAARGDAWPKRPPGKDSVTGHWEMVGIVLEQPFPTFPHGFPPEVMRRVRARHRPRTPRQRRRPRAPRSSTSFGDGAPAHRRADRLHVGRQRLPDRGARRRHAGAPSCIACARSPSSSSPRAWASAASSRGRSSAQLGAFRRTSQPPRLRAGAAHADTLLDRLTAAGHPVVAVGKIKDLFAGRGITRHLAYGVRRRGHGPCGRGAARRADAG